MEQPVDPPIQFGLDGGQGVVEPSRPEDRAPIGAVARSAGVFSPTELDTVFELFDQSQRDPSSGYNFLSYRLDGRVVGFACWGPTPLTDGTHDLYWICSERGLQRQGVGAALFRRVESEVRARGGRLIVIWTSDREAYAAARRFYDRMGCQRVAHVRDYYQPGEGLEIYTCIVSDPESPALKL